MSDQVQDFELRLALNRAGAMLKQLSGRYGEGYPFAEFAGQLHLLSLEQLAALRKAMHEVLYSPPSREVE